MGTPTSELKNYLDLPYSMSVQGSVGRSTYLATHTLEPSSHEYVPSPYLSNLASSSPYTYVRAGSTPSRAAAHTTRGTSSEWSPGMGLSPRSGASDYGGGGGAGAGVGSPRRRARGSPSRVHKRKGHSEAVTRMRRRIAEKRVRERDRVAKVRTKLEARDARLARVKADMAKAKAEEEARRELGSATGSESGSSVGRSRSRRRGSPGSSVGGGSRSGRDGKGSRAAAQERTGHLAAQMRMRHRKLEASKRAQSETRKTEREALIRTLYKQKRRADIRRRLNTPASYMEDGLSGAGADPIADELARLAAQMEAEDQSEADDKGAVIAPPPASFKALHFQADAAGRITVTPYEDMEDELLDLDNIDSIPDITYHTGDELSILSDMGDDELGSDAMFGLLDETDETAGPDVSSRFVPATEVRKRQGTAALGELAGTSWEVGFVEDVEAMAKAVPMPRRLADLLEASACVLGLGSAAELVDDPQVAAARVRHLLKTPAAAEPAALEAIQPFIDNPYYVGYTYRDDPGSASFLCALLRALDKFYVPAPRSSLDDLAMASLPPEKQAVATDVSGENAATAAMGRVVSDLGEYEWVKAFDPVYMAPYYVHTGSPMSSWVPPPPGSSVVELDLYRMWPQSEAGSQAQLQPQPQLDPASPFQLSILVAEAHGIEQVSAFGRCSPFVALAVDGISAVSVTSVVHNTVDPVYMETFEWADVTLERSPKVNVSVLQAERGVPPEESTVLFDANIDLATVRDGDVLWLTNELESISGRVALVIHRRLAGGDPAAHIDVNDLLALDDEDDGSKASDVVALDVANSSLDIDDAELDAALNDVQVDSDEEGLDDAALGLDDDDDLNVDDLLALDDPKSGAGAAAPLGVDDIDSDDIDLGLDDVDLNEDDQDLLNEDFGLDDIELDDEDVGAVDVDQFALSSESAPLIGLSVSTSPGQASGM